MSSQDTPRNLVPPQQSDLELVAPFIAAAGLSETAFVGQGLDCVVYKGISKKYGQVVVKIPRTKIMSCSNDPHIVAREQMEQELAIYKLLHGGLVPVPTPFQLLEVDDHPSIICEFVESDGTVVSPEELGRITALIHNTKLPENWDVRLVAEEGEPDGLTAVWKRVARRFRKLLEAEPHLADLAPTEDFVRPIADGLRRFPSCLNHLDLDHVNFRMRDGQTKAVIDWANALRAPAAVDIYRILEFGSSGDAFIEAYDRTAEFPALSEVEETFLRLDAALMLALVFIWEAPNPEGRGPAVKRVEELARALRV